jgi:hypothetical protein
MRGFFKPLKITQKAVTIQTLKIPFFKSLRWRKLSLPFSPNTPYFMKKIVMKRYLIVAALMLLVGSASAQSTDQQQVAAVIQQMFKGMYQSDSAMVRATITPDITMATVFTNKEGKVVISRKGNANELVKGMSTKQAEPLSEEIWGLTVQVDGDFAQAWCDYAFYFGNKFSHCGVDAFHLLRTPDGWKIFHIADTRRKTGCQIPADIEAKHKQ